MITRIPATHINKEYARSVHHLAYKDVVLRQFGNWDVAAQDDFFDEDWGASSFEIIKNNGQSVGYFGYRILNNEYHIMEIVLHPIYQGQGIGAIVIGSAISSALKGNLKVKLKVLKMNRAKNLYCRLGFVECGCTATHYLMEYINSAQQVDSAEASTIAAPPSEPPGSPR